MCLMKDRGKSHHSKQGVLKPVRGRSGLRVGRLGDRERSRGENPLPFPTGKSR